MNAPSQKVADLVNKNQSDSISWLLRHAIDDALSLFHEGSFSSADMEFLLKWASGRAAESMESQATHYPKQTA